MPTYRANDLDGLGMVIKSITNTLTLPLISKKDKNKKEKHRKPTTTLAELMDYLK